MKKLILDLDTLHVDTFEASPAVRAEGGTVEAYEFTEGASCWGTCGYSCGGTCGQGTCYGETCVCWPPKEGSEGS